MKEIIFGLAIILTGVGVFTALICLLGYLFKKLPAKKIGWWLIDESEDELEVGFIIFIVIMTLVVILFFCYAIGNTILK